MAVLSLYMPERLALESDFGAGGFLTDVIEVKDGTEQRVARRPYPRRSYNISFAPSNQTDIAALETLINETRGMKDAFLIKDPTDYTLTDELILTATGGETTAQVKKTIGSTNPLSRTIRYVSGLVVKVNGVAQTLTTDYTVSSTALITFTSPLSPADEVTVSCTFYTPVRFASDDFQKSPRMPGAEIMTVQRIPLVEILE